MTGRPSVLRAMYLGLALWGAVHPMLWFWRHMEATGGGLKDVVAAWSANAATIGLTWDLVIAACALSLWVIAETWVRRNWIALLVLPATWGVGLACGLPLYLYLRTAPIR